MHPDIFSSMKSKNEFVIPFEGLKIGKYLYEYQVDTSFFEELDYSIIQGGDIKVNFNLEKKETMMLGQFEMEGTVQLPCDRCNDLMETPITVSHLIIYKFSDEDISEDENLIVLPSSAFTIDITNNIYELLTVALPTRVVHEENECNEEMLDLLYGFEDPEDDEEDNDEDIDPRWNDLKKLK